MYEYFITSLITILLPGTGVIYTVSTAITNGRKASFCAATGCTLGIIPHLCLSILLSTCIFELNELVFSVVQIIGVLYLIYLGVCMMISKTDIQLGPEDKKLNCIHTVLKGILINLLNPKLTIFFFAFLPQYINKDNRSIASDSMILGLIFILLTWIVFIFYGILSSLIRNRLMNDRVLSVTKRLFGVVFICFAVKILFSLLKQHIII